MRIAALIPVYSEPKALVSICKRLAADSYQDKEIVVVVDGETTAPIAAALDRVKDMPRLRVLRGKGHLGKAEALNQAARETEAEALLFLDNDIFLPPSPAFLDLLASQLEKHDLVELPKVGMGEGLLAQMMKLEFLANIYSAEGMAALFDACPSMNGAAFAIKKELFEGLGGFAATVNEDMDLAARSFLAGRSFAFPSELSVGNAVSESPADWWKQRKRWMANNAIWSQNYLFACLRSSPEAAWAMLASAFRFALPWLSMIAGALPAIIIAELLGSGPHWILLAAALGAGGAWTIAAGSYERCARRYGAQFHFGYFLLYTTLYMPPMALANLAVAVSIALGAMPRLDWKLAKGQAEIAGLRRRQGARAAASRSGMGWITDTRLGPPKSLGLSLAYARYRAHAGAERGRD